MRRVLPMVILALTVLLTVGVWAEDAAKKEEKPAEKTDEKKAEQAEGDDKAAAEDEPPVEDAKLVVRKFSKRKIYAGDIRSWTSPCAIRLRDVFGRIKYYEAAKESRKGSAQYWVYMTKANKVFKQACRYFVRDSGYDLVCEVDTLVVAVQEGDTVVGLYPIPDVTDEFIALLDTVPEEE